MEDYVIARFRYGVFLELKAELHFFEERVRTDLSMFPLFRTGGKVSKSTVHPRLILAYEAREGYIFVVDAWDTRQDLKSNLPHATTSTPFQKATRPAISLAASKGSRYTHAAFSFRSSPGTSTW